MVVVQRVEIQWSKRSRGGAGAQRRARLPRAFRLPGIPSPFLLHQVDLAEWNGFEMRVREERGERPRSIEDVIALRHMEVGTLAVDLVGSPRHGGHPWRAPKAEVLRLAAGEFGRLTINGRQSTEDGSAYVEQTYNLCHGEVVPVDRFVDATPDHAADFLAVLF